MAINWFVYFWNSSIIYTDASFSIISHLLWASCFNLMYCCCYEFQIYSSIKAFISVLIRNEHLEYFIFYQLSQLISLEKLLACIFPKLTLNTRAFSLFYEKMNFKFKATCPFQLNLILVPFKKILSRIHF